MTSSVPAIVVGAGISGLTCANALRKAGVNTQVLEASPRAGGIIASERRDGFLLELGPQSFSRNAALQSLCVELGIADLLIEAPSGGRYVLVDGALRAVPLNPAAMMASSLLSSRTKWRLAGDLFGTTHPPEEDESIAAFVRRKFGEELLDRLVAPFVSGIYAGDPAQISLRAAFPQVYEAEKSAGSVIRGMRRAAKARKGPHERSTLFGFRGGNEILTRTLAQKIASRLRLGVEVLGIGVGREGGTVRFEVSIREATSERIVVSENLVLATPADAAGALLRDVNAAFEPVLAGIEYAPVALVSLGYRRGDVGHSLDGFGFLVPRSSGLRVLGSVWNSSLFPERAPAEHVLLTSFVGGATDPGAAELSSENLVALVHRELAQVLQINAAPVFSHVQIYRRALPQYNIGHTERLMALEKLCGDLPGLFLVGNYLHGPAIGNCVELGTEAAEAILTNSKSA
jgi:oxygen-dependent protoporphyrinogen oxidase